MPEMGIRQGRRNKFLPGEPSKVPSLKEVNFGKVKLSAVEHFWTDFDLTKRRDNKMDQIF